MVNNFVDRSEIYWMPNFVIFGGVCIGVTTIQKVGGRICEARSSKPEGLRAGVGFLGGGKILICVFWD